MSEKLIFASVGTDHHPFDRLVDWLDEVAVLHPEVRVVVQHGHSRAPAVAEGHEFLDHAKLTELMSAADVIVCHGGPGTIMDARAQGRQPVCVPRDPAHGEHVDGHQMRFVRTISSAGVVSAPADRAAFLRTVAAQLSGPRGPVVHVPQQRRGSGVPALVVELESLLDTDRSDRPGRLAIVGRFLRGRSR